MAEMINPDYLTDKDRQLRNAREEIRFLKRRIQVANETIIRLQAQLDERLAELWRMDQVNRHQRAIIKSNGIERGLFELPVDEEEVVDA